MPRRNLTASHNALDAIAALNASIVASWVGNRPLQHTCFFRAERHMADAAVPSASLSDMQDKAVALSRYLEADALTSRDREFRALVRSLAEDVVAYRRAN